MRLRLGHAEAEVAISVRPTLTNIEIGPVFIHKYFAVYARIWCVTFLN